MFLFVKGSFLSRGGVRFISLLVWIGIDTVHGIMRTLYSQSNVSSVLLGKIQGVVLLKFFGVFPLRTKALLTKKQGTELLFYVFACT